MTEHHDHRDDCPFKFATLDVCDCVKKNILDRIEQLAVTNEALIAELKTSEEIGRAFEEDAGQLREKLAECEVRLGKAVEALRFYAWENEMRLPSDGPWGAGSTDFGKVARATLAEIKEESRIIRGLKEAIEHAKGESHE